VGGAHADAADMNRKTIMAAVLLGISVDAHADAMHTPLFTIEEDGPPPGFATLSTRRYHPEVDGPVTTTVGEWICQFRVTGMTPKSLAAISCSADAGAHWVSIGAMPGARDNMRLENWTFSHVVKVYQATVDWR
jgi:hypothetical protein